MAEKLDHPVKDIVIPLAVVVALIGNAWWGGVGWGKVSNQLSTVIDQIATITKRTDSVESRISEIEQWRALKDKEDKDLLERFRLFRMYTKGRIAKLPYRATDDGE